MKRTTKAPKLEAEKHALRMRMCDLLYGAHGGYEIPHGFPSTDEMGAIVAEFGSDTFGRWLGAMQQQLTFETDQQRDHIAKPRVLDKYDDLDGAVDFLFGLGVRA